MQEQEQTKERLEVTVARGIADDWMRRAEAARESLLDVRLTDDQSHRVLTDRLAQAKAIQDDMDAERKNLSDPHYRLWEAINALFRDALAVLKEPLARRKREAATWIVEEERRREAQLIAQREAERRAQASAGGAAVIKPKEAPPQVARHVDTGYGKSTLRQRPAYKLVSIVDLARAVASGDVEPDLIEVKRSAVMARLHADHEARGQLRPIPGLEVYYDADLAIGRGALRGAREDR